MGAVLDSVLCIAMGIALIKWSVPVAKLLGESVGTSIIRDLDNPFVIKILGIVFAVGGIVTLIVQLMHATN